MPVDPEKLAKLQKASAKKVGGKRVAAKKTNKSSEQDDTKLQEVLQSLKAQTLTGIEEANFFQDDGKVLHFNRVGVQSAQDSNTFSFTGYPQEKSIVELIPQILPQLGAENLQMLQQLANQMQALQGSHEGHDHEGHDHAHDEEIPELTQGEKFDDVE